MFVLVCEVHCEQKCEGSAVDFFGVFHPLCRRFLKMVNCKEQRCLMPKSQPEVRCFRTWVRCLMLDLTPHLRDRNTITTCLDAISEIAESMCGTLDLEVHGCCWISHRLSSKFRGVATCTPRR